MPFASVADRIIFVADVIGKEFVSVGDDKSLKCCVTDTVKLGPVSGKNLLPFSASNLFAIWIS